MTSAPTSGGNVPADSTPNLGGLAAASGRQLSRRRLLRAAGLAAAAVPVSSALAACSGGSSGGGGARPVRIGYVSPQTGALSAFSDSDSYTVQAMQSFFSKGLPVGNQTHPVQIIVRDSQSDTNRAAQAASDLIFKDRVDVMLVASTPETTNPVSDQCEANQVPCISTIAPWQSWYLGRQLDPAHPKPFKWTYHFFWGLEDLEAIYLDMWNAVPTNKRVGGLWPMDSDGDAFADPNTGFPATIRNNGYTLPPNAAIRYTDLVSSDAEYQDMVNKFQSANVDIVTGVPLTFDFDKFWTLAQAATPVYVPKVVTVAKALLFPSALELLGSSGQNLATEIWWSPNHPFNSSLNGLTASALAKDYTAKTGKQWVQTLGFSHALFEVVAAALAVVDSIDNKEKIVNAIANVKVSTIVGPIKFGDVTGVAPTVPKNVAKTPLVGGQWRQNISQDPYDMVITSNGVNKNIRAQSKFAPIVHQSATVQQ